MIERRRSRRRESDTQPKEQRFSISLLGSKAISAIARISGKEVTVEGINDDLIEVKIIPESSSDNAAEQADT